MKSKYQKYLIPIILIVPIIIFFNKIIFQTNIFVTGDFLRSDTINQNLPFKYTLFQSLKNNQLPLWIDTISAGFPLAAEGQTGVFYPLNIIAFKILPFVNAYNFLIVINFIILALGTYFFVRELKLGRYASIIAAVIYPFSSFFILHITHQNIIASASWIPFIFFANYKYFKGKNVNYLFLSILFVSLSILAGSVQITFYALFSLFIFLLLFAKLFQFSKKKIIAFYLIEILTSVIISSVQLIPSLELMFYSSRSQGLGSVALNSLPFHFRNLITFVAPYAFGDPGLGTYPTFGGSWGMFWENTAYLGIIPLFLAFFTLKEFRKKSEIKYFWILFIFSILLALGKYSPLFWIYYLPLFNSFRVTSRFLVVSLFYLTLISAYGLDKLIYSFKDGANRIIVTSFVLLFSFSDLFLFGYGYNPTAKIEDVLTTPQNADFISRNGMGGRIFSIASTIKYDEINKNGWRDNNFKNIFHENALDPDVNILWGIKNLDGYSGLNLESNSTFIKNALFDSVFADRKVILSENGLKALGIANVEYIVSPYLLINKLDLVFSSDYQNQSYNIYKNPYFVPRGFLANSYNIDFESFDFSSVDTSSVANIKDESNDIVFNITSDTDKWFILQDTYYPGWEAFLNGKKVEIQRSINTFGAVEVPPGKSTLEFIYKPKSINVGFILTSLSIALFLASWFFLSRRNSLNSKNL